MNIETTPIRARFGRREDGVWVGLATAEAYGRPWTVAAVALDERPIYAQAYRLALARAHELAEQAAVQGVEIGWNPFKWAKKMASKLTKKVMRLKIVKKIGRAAKNALKTLKAIAESPITAGIVAAISATVPGAQPLALAYGGLRAALTIADNVRKGDPQALSQVKAIAENAAAGHPGAKEVFQKIKSANEAIALSGKPVNEILSLLPAAA